MKGFKIIILPRLVYKLHVSCSGENTKPKPNQPTKKPQQIKAVQTCYISKEKSVRIPKMKTTIAVERVANV